MPDSSIASNAQSKALFDEEQGYISPGIQTIALLSELTIESGTGCDLTDIDGNTYLDFNAGVSVASLGYAHPAYVAAMQQQVAQVIVGSFTSRPRLELSKLLAELFPGKIRRAQLFSGGAEAVEAAIKLARSYTKRQHVVGFRGAFHGKTFGVLSLSDVDWKSQVGPLTPGFSHAPFPEPYHFDGDPEILLERTLKELRTVIERDARDNLAAVIVEPIQGTNGNVVPPPGFLTEVRKIAHEYGGLFIADEMITGFGRTGKLFGVMHDGVEPDIMTVGKGLGSGFPVSAVASSDEIMKAEPFSLPSMSSSSYGGNPLAARAALVTLQTIVKDNLVENSDRVGAFLKNGLLELQEKYPFIGDVRGRGLLIGAELVKERQSREKLDKHHCVKFFRECLKRGLIVMGYSPRVRIHPPLILTREQAQRGLDIMDEAFAVVAKYISC